jgi:hypothetical protein
MGNEDIVGRLQLQVQRADDARVLLANPVLNKFFEDQKREFMQAFLTCEVADLDVWRTRARVVQDLERELASRLEEGNTALRRLSEIGPKA